MGLGFSDETSGATREIHGRGQSQSETDEWVRPTVVRDRRFGPLPRTELHGGRNGRYGRRAVGYTRISGSGPGCALLAHEDCRVRGWKEGIGASNRPLGIRY